MKSQMSALDIKAAVQECQGLTRGRVTKVLAGKSVLSLAVHTAEKGKVWITARIPGFFYATQEKPEVGSPSPFQAALKKHVEGLKVESISQFGFERAISIKCAGTEDRAEIVIEIFSPGNAVLVKDDKVFTALKRPDNKDSRYCAGSQYCLPKSKPTAWEMSETEIDDLLTSSKEAASFVLGRSGLGGLWAREACIRAKTDPSKPVSGKEAKGIAAQIAAMAKEAVSPRKVFEGDLIIDVTPFALKTYENNVQEKTLMGEGIQSLLAQSRNNASSYTARIEKVGLILEKQREHLLELEKDVEENRCRGELIYEKYQLVSQILESIRKARETLSWKEIKTRLKNHPIIKDIEESTGSIIIEL